MTFENSPVFVTAGPPGHALEGAAGAPTHRCSSRWREGGLGDQTWGTVMILDLHRQGLSVSVIARRLGVGPKDRQDLHRQGAGAADLQKRAPARGSLIPSNRICASVWGLSRPNRRRLFREIKERGFSGGYSAVRDRVRDIRPARTLNTKFASRRRPASRRKSTSPGSRSSSSTSPASNASSGCSRWCSAIPG